MSTENSDHPEMFSRDWYNEYFKRTTSSKAHSQFCEKVYGRDLCQHGLMDIEELDFLVTLIKPHSKILEIGCSNGYITEYIHDRTNSEILGLDFSNVAIEQARERTRAKAATLLFERVDITREDVPGDDYDYIILIDSIYFLGDFKKPIEMFGKKLGCSGKLVISAFQDDDGLDKVLHPDNTYLAQAFKGLGYTYEWHDFTENVRAHGMKNYQVGEELREAFEAEGNGFLYEARAAENRFFKECAEKGSIVRYMYVVRQVNSA